MTTAPATLLATVLLLAPAPTDAATGDLRSRELLDYGCASDLSDERVTLFGNGTLRLRRQTDEVDEMFLAELAPEELTAYLNRLRSEDLREAESPRFGPVGEWIEQCDLTLALPGDASRRYRFGRFDSLGLTLSRVVGIARELIGEAQRRDTTGGLPAGYLPRPGDLLERVDGRRFEIVGFTWDGRGLELRGVDTPIILYLPASAVSDEFTALLERGPE